MSEEGSGYEGPGTRSQLELLNTDDVFHLLSHRRKRAVLLLLALSPHDRVHLQQLAETICALEDDCSVDVLETATVTNGRRNLKRSHLGPLADAGVIKPGDELDVYVPGPSFGVAFMSLAYGGYSLVG